jgi:hypothetical protein
MYLLPCNKQVASKRALFTYTMGPSHITALSSITILSHIHHPLSHPLSLYYRVAVYRRLLLYKTLELELELELKLPSSALTPVRSTEIAGPVRCGYA